MPAYWQDHTGIAPNKKTPRSLLDIRVGILLGKHKNEPGEYVDGVNPSCFHDKSRSRIAIVSDNMPL